MNTATADSPQILLIETDETLAQSVSVDLQGSGYETAIAQDAISGLRKFQQRSLCWLWSIGCWQENQGYGFAIASGQQAHECPF